MQMKAFYCDQFVLPLPESHSFPMAKYRKLRERIVDDGIIEPEGLVQPEAAAIDQLLLVHDAQYVHDVIEGRLTRDAQRQIGFPWSPAMVERSRRSVGGTIAAIRTAMAEGAAVNLAGGTHHAFRDRGAGYCVFNDIAVAARVLQREHPRGGRLRIAIVDCDVHQGDGTAAIFSGDPSVFTMSIHGARNFPFRKQTSDFDVMLDDGTGDDEYLAALGRALTIVEERHQPDVVFYLAGADPYDGDRLGRLSLTIDGLRARDEMVVGRFRGRPMAACMGGGYCPDVDVIARIHANTVREMRNAEVPCATAADRS